MIKFIKLIPAILLFGCVAEKPVVIVKPAPKLRYYTNSYPVVFTPKDTNNFTCVTGMVSVIVVRTN